MSYFEAPFKQVIKVHIPFLILTLGILQACSGPDFSLNLVPQTPATAPNYWCTWYWQNYLIRKGQPVTNPDAATVYSNVSARESMNQETIFGATGMARVMLPHTRGDYYFVIDHGWQDKNLKDHTFTLVMDTLDFPRYAHLAPKDRIKQMNKDIKDLGWRRLGLWVRGNPDEQQMRTYVNWSKYAGIEYWKIDGGDIETYYATQIKNEIYPELFLEHITGAGPVNPKWDKPGLQLYPSIYHPGEDTPQELEASLNAATEKVAKSLEVIQNTDVFRTYDAAPLMVTTTTLQRIHDILMQTAGEPEYTALLNIQDDPNVAAALGLVVAVKRHPMHTPRMYKGKDLHFQIYGDRHVDQRLNEMDRFVLWQRIAPPMPAGYGSFRASKTNLIDSIFFTESDTWYKATYEKMVYQSAPAVMARNLPLPEVQVTGPAPYVMASRFKNGAIAVATEGRVTPDSSWFHPQATVTLKDIETDVPIGIFGYYQSLNLKLKKELPKDFRIYAQDLLARKATDITGEVTYSEKTLRIPGTLIKRVGTAENDTGDISAPGLVLKILSSTLSD